jgi:protein arginine kinase
VRPATSAKTPLEPEAMPKPPAWAGETGWEADVILSTRVRLARNLAAAAFPGRAGDTELKAVAEQVLAVAKRRDKGHVSLRAVEIGRLGEADKAALVDSHLISVPHAMAGPNRWALVDDKHTVSVMVNEEDHLRLQAILPGLQIDAAYRVADQMDDQFGSHLDYAFDPHYGYLTSSLSNCGTGLRVSVMAHLPGLALSGKIEGAMEAAKTLGAAVRGPYGEHSASAGDVYQISNAVSTGKSERQLLTRLAATATLLLTDEQAARELLWRDQRSLIEEKVGDAQVRLKSAERLSAGDSMALLSILRLGAQFGMTTGVTNRIFNELLSSLRLGAQFVSGEKAQYTFYEETRRPALIRNKIRENRR